MESDYVTVFNEMRVWSGISREGCVWARLFFISEQQRPSADSGPLTTAGPNEWIRVACFTERMKVPRRPNL